MLPPLLIVNPACGARSTARSLPQILARVEQALVMWPSVTQRAAVMPASWPTRGHGKGYPLIVAVGGDGTFSEVANGVLALEDESATVLSQVTGPVDDVPTTAAGGPAPVAGRPALPRPPLPRPARQWD